MHRYHNYAKAIPDTIDQSNPQTEGLVALSRLATDVFFAAANPIGSSGATTRAAGFIPSFPTGMVIDFADGRLYTLAQVDATAFDSRGVDTRMVLQQAQAEASALTFAAAPSTGSRIDLVQVAYQQVDDTGRVYLYYAGPGMAALQGPTGAGESQNSRRAATAVIVVKTGVAGATPVAPTADTGYFPLFQVTVPAGTTNLTSSNIAVASSAPFYNGTVITDTLVEHVANKGVASGYASLDGSGKVPVAQIPSYAITDVFTVSSQAAMLALTAQQGDIARRSDLSQQFILAGTGDPTVLANWLEWLIPTDTAYLDVAQTWTAQQQFNAPVSFSGSTYAEVEAGTFYLTQNCYFDGTNWQRVNTANPYAAEALDPYGKRLFFAGPAGANPIGTTLQARDLADEYFSTDWHVTSGLTYGYLKGLVVLNNTITQVAANSIGLTASATNYFEVDPGAGVVYVNTVGFTAGRMPISTIVTNATTVAPNGVTPANSSFIKFTGLPSDLQCSAGALLVLNYAAGLVNLGGVPTSIAANTLNLPASSTCYVYLTSAGVVAFNTTGFMLTGTPIPMAQVTTGATAITGVADKRAFLTLGGASGNPITRNAIQSALMDATSNDKGAFLHSSLYSVAFTPANAISGGDNSTYVKGNAFDGNASTAWYCTQVTADQSGNAYIGQDAGVGNTMSVSSLTITTTPNTLNQLSSYLYQTSPDGTTWTTTDTLSMTLAVSVVQTIPLGATRTSRAWRLLANANTPAGNTSGFAEIAYSGASAGQTAIDHLATAAPTAFSFANGLNTDSTFANVNAQLTADQLGFYGGLTASATNYLFTKLAGSVLSGIAGPYAQTIQTVAPASPATGARYYDPMQNKSFNWNGTAWVQEEVIPVGECVTNSSGQVTSYTAYPPLRRYDSQNVPCAASTAITHYHNLGFNGALIQVETSIDNGVTWVPCAVTGATRLSVSFTTPASATLYRVQTRDTFA